MKTAIIDIDNTLWNFADVLYERLLKVCPELPPPNEWVCWDFFDLYMPEGYFYKVADQIHKEQDRFGVFPDAREFLEDLYVNGYRIIIASHRDKESKEATLRWLYKHKLIFHDLHLSFDKTVLFRPGMVVVDDSPLILEKALDKGLKAMGIEYPWNRQNRFRLFKSLSEIRDFLLTCQ